MDNKDIIEKVLTEKASFHIESASELREMLDDELSKPEKQIDYGLVDELTTAIIETEESERQVVSVDMELNKFHEHTSKHDKIIHLLICNY